MDHITKIAAMETTTAIWEYDPSLPDNRVLNSSLDVIAAIRTLAIKVCLSFLCHWWPSNFLPFEQILLQFFLSILITSSSWLIPMHSFDSETLFPLGYIPDSPWSWYDTSLTCFTLPWPLSQPLDIDLRSSLLTDTCFILLFHTAIYRHLPRVA
jgi:hypothetical protein